MLKSFLVGALIVSFLSFGSLARSCDNVRVRQVRNLCVSHDNLVVQRVVVSPHFNVVRKVAVVPQFLVEEVRHLRAQKVVQKVVVRQPLFQNLRGSVQNLFQNLRVRNTQKVVVKRNISTLRVIQHH